MATFQGVALANGDLPAGLLSGIDMSRVLRLDAADSWLRVVAQVQAEHGWTPALNDGQTAYRDLDGQVAIFLARYDHTQRPGLTAGNGGIVRWNDLVWFRKPKVATAAAPGTSNHGWGMAADVDLDGWKQTRQVQFMAVARTHGWTETEGQRINEPWHKVYDPASDRGGGVATTPEVDLDATQDTMLREIHAALGAGGAITLPEAGTLLALVRHIDSQTNGLPTAVASLAASTNGTPEALAALGKRLTDLGTALTELAGVTYQGTTGTPLDQTVYQLVRHLSDGAPG
jgi:hypothetical protein